MHRAKASSATIADMLKAGLDADQAFIGNQNGDANAIAAAAKKVEAVYAYPFLNRATMEPMNATARWAADRCEVWVPTQNGEAPFAATMAASGLPADKSGALDAGGRLTGLHVRLSGQSILAAVFPRNRMHTAPPSSWISSSS